MDIENFKATITMLGWRFDVYKTILLVPSQVFSSKTKHQRNKIWSNKNNDILISIKTDNSIGITDAEKGQWKPSTNSQEQYTEALHFITKN